MPTWFSSRPTFAPGATLIALLALAAPAIAGGQQRPAQQPQAQQAPLAQPGVLIVSYQKCAMGTLQEFTQWRKANWTPLADQAVREGRLMGYGELEHGWGDEWNYVHYFAAKDEQTFHQAFAQLMAEAMKRDPQIMTTLGRYCTEHKDNIYTVSHVSPPAAAPARRP